MRLVHQIAVCTVRGAGVASSVKICTPTFMKICQLLQNLKRRTHSGTHILSLSAFIHFVMKGKWVKISCEGGYWVDVVRTVGIGYMWLGRWVLGECG
jgi:hypothetical protein